MTVYTRTHAPNKPQATLASDYITTVGCMLGRILMQFKLFELSTSLHAQLATSICTCGINIGGIQCYDCSGACVCTANINWHDAT